MPGSGTVTLRVKATVQGETLYVQKTVYGAVWDDVDAREAIEHSLRMELVSAILEKWKPVVTVTRT
jgi:hypothetical protein